MPEQVLERFDSASSHGLATERAAAGSLSREQFIAALDRKYLANPGRCGRAAHHPWLREPEEI